jgi:hypothetical protein
MMPKIKKLNSRQRGLAYAAVAEGKLSDKDIAKSIDSTVAALREDKKRPNFATKVKQIREVLVHMAQLRASRGAPSQELTSGKQPHD